MNSHWEVCRKTHTPARFVVVSTPFPTHADAVAECWRLDFAAAGPWLHFVRRIP